MLVLSRKKGDGITIDHPAGPIHVIVVEIRGDKVRIGIEAPNEVPAHRDEVWAAIHRNGKRSKTTSTIPGASLPPENRGSP